MLTNLYVSDLALIRRLSVDFHRGFSVLTGQTGAGKSLVLDAIRIFFLPRGAAELVREGAERLEVSLFFSEIGPEAAAALSDFFSSEELEEGVTLSRTVTREGKSTCRAGGRVVPFAKAQELARVLISFHGQHAAGGLLEEKNHREYLDAALPASGKTLLAEYEAAFEAYTAEKRRLEEMKALRGNEEETLALLDFRMREIARVKPKIGEDEELEARLASLQKGEKRHGILSVASRALSGGERGRGAAFLVEAAAAKLAGLGQEDPLYEISAKLYDALETVREAADEVSYRLSEMGQEDPAEAAETIRARLDALYKLKLKYGGSLEAVVAAYGEMKEKKELTLSLKDDIERATVRLEGLEKTLREKGEALSEARRAVARRLEDQIHSVLAFLDMPRMRFFAEITPTSPTRHGADQVRFLLAANVGEGTKSLSKVASGGELSRIMLALQLKLGRGRDADTLIFDEVDTGISGATAQKVGIALRTLSQTKQVFCVTHSAQVSTLANERFLVEKTERDGRTETSVRLLDEKESLEENARLLGGATVTEKARQAAENLRLLGLEEWNKWKDTVL